MANRRPLTQAELEEMAETVSDQDYCDSEYGGDDDADDFLPEVSSLSSNSSFVPSPSIESLPGTSTNSEQPLQKVRKCTQSKKVLIPESDDETFDDSDLDPDFLPEDDIGTKTNRLARLFTANDFSDDDMQEEELDIPARGISPTTRAASSDSFVWSKKNNPDLSFQSFDFTESSTVNVVINSEKPTDYFRVFFGENICQKITKESNLYASQKNTHLFMDLEELNAFLGILIFMGFHSLPTLRSYWSNNENFHVERVTKVFTLKRFLKILRYLHLNNNETMPKPKTPEFDRLYKLRPLIKHLTDTFQSAFTPYRYLSIDESMCAFKGRTTLKQYMPMKPIKRGFKIWALACATTGYLLNFQIYQGKTAESSSDMLGERVVLEMSSNYQNRGYCLYFDNFFTTIPLMQKLLSQKTFGCGTIRQTRKHFPKHILCADRELSHGQFDSVACGEISVYKWKDRGVKSVSVVSNHHKFKEQTQVLRTNKTGNRENVPCPQSIADYNRHMGGVDLFDQYHANYSVAWKSRRWWLKIFYYLLDAAIVNSYILYKESLKKNNPSAKPLTALQYRSELANNLIGTFTFRKKSGPPPKKTALSSVGLHLPIKGTYRRCVLCSSSKKKQTRSNLICQMCKVALCKDCFAPYHKN